MRNLERNKRPVWYRLCEGREPVLDEDGADTGETAVAYAPPVMVRANVSPATGSSSQELFGVGVEYDRVVQLPGAGWPVDERTVLYVSRAPTGEPVTWDGASGEWRSQVGSFSGAATYDRYASGADYAVVRVAESLNQTSLAIRKVRDSDG